jgi:hypothetical protein
MILDKILYKFCIFFTFSFCSLFTLAQETSLEEIEQSETYGRIKPLHSFSLEVGLPVALKNNYFKQYVQGMIYISPYYHYSFKNYLTAGIGLDYNYFWINHVFTNDPKNLGGIQSIGSFMRFGFEKFYTDRYGLDLNIKLGQSSLIFDTDKNRKLGKLPSLNVFTVEPSIGFVVTADDRSSYRWVVSYTTQKYDFRPTLLGFTKDNSSNNESSSYTNFLSVGFGYTYYIKQR